MSIQDLTLGLVETAKRIAEDSAAYKKFFNDSLKKFGVTSPEELSAEKKKEFYNHIDANWNSDDEPGSDGKKDKPKKDVDEGKGMPPWLKKGKKDDKDSEDEDEVKEEKDDEDEEDEEEVEEGLNANYIKSSKEKKDRFDLKASACKSEEKEDDEDEDEEEVEEGKLPPALQKAIDKKKGKDSDDEDEVKENKYVGGYRNSSRDGQQGPSSKPKHKPNTNNKNSSRPAGFGDAKDDSIRSQIERLYKQRDSFDATASSAREAGNDDKADHYEDKGNDLTRKIRELKDKLKDKNESNTLDANLLERVLKELNIG